MTASSFVGYLQSWTQKKVTMSFGPALEFNWISDFRLVTVFRSVPPGDR